MPARQKTLLDRFVAFWVSLKLTIACLALGMVLILVGTVAQKHMTIDEALERYFRTLFVWGAPFERIGFDTEFPIFPGGFLVGSVLLLNLVAAHLYRFKPSWRKSGILIIHGGLILLLLGELLTTMFKRESYLTFDEGQTVAYSTSRSEAELAIIDRSDPNKDRVAAIADFALQPGQIVEDAGLPFKVRTLEFFRFSQLVPRRVTPRGVGPPEATQGAGLKQSAVPVARPKKENTASFSAAWVELSDANGVIGTWLVSTELEVAQPLTHDGKTYTIELRDRRYQKEFSLTLLDFRFDRYAGTETARNFSSLVRLNDPVRHEDREVLIYMNHPLRHAGYTFYQHSFGRAETNSILEVVKNPSWLLPYFSCIMAGLGMLIQFGIHLVGFIRRRRLAPAIQPAAAT